MQHRESTVWTPLCALDDIARRSSRRFTVGTVEIVLVRKFTRVFAYRNRCPHQSISLDMGSEDVLTDDRRYILCANHAALFEIETGACVSGPCFGEGLEPVEVKEEEGRVWVRVT